MTGKLGGNFRLEAKRRVMKDRTVGLHGRLYEADAGLVGQSVPLRYDPDAPPSRPIKGVHDGNGAGRATRLDAKAPAPSPPSTSSTPSRSGGCEPVLPRRAPRHQRPSPRSSLRAPQRPRLRLRLRPTVLRSDPPLLHGAGRGRVERYGGNGDAQLGVANQSNLGEPAAELTGETVAARIPHRIAQRGRADAGSDSAGRGAHSYWSVTVRRAPWPRSTQSMSVEPCPRGEPVRNAG